MRRYSEILNTPTPATRAGEIKVGSLITIPNTGRAILRYIGPVDGKPGKFAGFELLGDSAVLGKNSGDVNGVEYFKTSQPGAGLFMSYDKLISTLDGIDSPRSSRISLHGPPGGVRFNQTPSRQGSQRASQHSTSTKRPSAVTRTHTSSSTTPTLNSAVSSNTKNSPSAEREIQRLLDTKTVIQNERDDLLQETEDLKRQLKGAHDRLDENDSLLKQLQQSYDVAQEKLEMANERVAQAENKLIKQRRAYEDQRKELLEVIDQVEAQVNDNESLYIGELKKLQEELQQKQQIIDDVQSKLKSLEQLYAEQKDATCQVEDHQLGELQAEIQNLKLTNMTQAQAIEKLRDEIKQKEERLTTVSKESLELKEAHITDKSNMDAQLKEQKLTLNKLHEELALREHELLDLREELKLLREKNEAVSRDISEPAAIDELKAGHESAISELKMTIEDLTKRLQSSVSSDKLQELEFKLENKEAIVNDLRALLDEERSKATESVSSSKSVAALTADIADKSQIIDTLRLEVKTLKQHGEQLKSFEEEVAARDSKLKELETALAEKELELKSHKDTFSRHENSAQELKKELEEKRKLLSKAQKDIEQLSADLEKALLLKEQVDALSSSKTQLDELVSAKDSEIEQLTTKMKEMTGLGADSDQSTSEPQKFSESPELEEKILEIEILKDEISLLKSADSQQEIETLKSELSLLKKQNRYTTNRELLEQIQLLQQELSTRPTTDEVQQLRSELELAEQLRLVESRTKDKEIYQLKEKLYGRGSAPGTAPGTPSQATDTDSIQSLKKFKKKDMRSSQTLSPISMNRPPVISQVVDGALQVYVPEGKKDPGNGRKQWCGLCERDGHDSIDCPYENDIF